MKRTTLLFIFLCILLVVLLVLSAMLGAVKIKALDVLVAVFKPELCSKSSVYIIRQMRLPRATCAVLSGALLALSGLVFQCVFRNPMADSYVLGISSASSLSVAFALLFGLSLSSATLPIVAFFGAMVAAVLLFSTSKHDAFELLLSGIAMNFLFSALTTLLVYIKKRELEAIMYWTMGSLANSTWTRCIIQLLILLTVFILLEADSSAMDIMLLDNSTALSTGVNIYRSRIKLLLIASISTAAVVSYCGVIGFVGLMSPHFVRLICGPKHKHLIPLSMLMGSNLLLISDIISRTVLSPSELPVGIITSILGAPLFFILLKRRKSWMK